MKPTNYDTIINRIGYFRNKANLSARETSLRLGYNPQFIKTIESKNIELKVRTLLDFCEIVDITPEDFFCLGEEYSKENKELLHKYNKLSPANKETIKDLINKLQ